MWLETPPIISSVLKGQRNIEKGGEVPLFRHTLAKTDAALPFSSILNSNFSQLFNYTCQLRLKAASIVAEGITLLLLTLTAFQAFDSVYQAPIRLMNTGNGRMVAGLAVLTILANFSVYSQTPSYQAMARGPNSCVWAMTNYEADANGQIAPYVHKYTELATGLNHLVNGQWGPSSEVIDILPDGSAAGTNCQHQVYFPPDIYNGEITMVTPDGEVLRSRPVGLSYDDGSNTVMIAVLTNSTGELVSSNEVIYPNAFAGLNADLRYTYTKAGFEQDIVIQEQPPMPENFNLNPQNTQLQILTEFFDSPQPSLVGNAADNNLSFGVMQIRRGRAFLAGTNSVNVSISKQWLQLDGRQFLVEEAPMTSLLPELQLLPASTAQIFNPRKPPFSTIASATRWLPPPHPAKAKHEMMALVGTPVHDGLVLDYQTVNSSLTNYIFRADTTYYISGNVYLFGTNTFEGGTVIKYNNTSINFDYPAMIQTWASSYRPVIFTFGGDTTVGANTPNGGGGNPALSYTASIYGYQTSSLTLNNFRISDAQEAIYASGDFYLTLRDGQIIGCDTGFEAEGPGSFETFENMLFVDSETDLILAFANVTAENVTFAGNGDTALSRPEGAYPYTGSAPYTLTMTNCILGNEWTFILGPNSSIGGSYNGFYYDYGSTIGTHCTDLGSYYPFQSAGAGYYYLNYNSFLYAGTPNIDPVLYSDILSKTVYPPDTNSYVNTTISTPTAILPTVTHDNPDYLALGYHYDPIDYIVDELAVSNTLLTVSNSIYSPVLASYNEPGIKFQNGGAIISSGMAAIPNWFVRYQSVQEETIFLGGTNVSLGKTISGTNNGGAAVFQFSRFSVPAGGGYNLYDTGTSTFSNLMFQECEFYGGANDFSGTNSTSSVILQNNLFQRSSIYASNNSTSATLAISNNLFWGTTATIHQPSGGTWYAYNNDFDSTIITNSSLNNGYNAYLGCSGYLASTNSTDIFSNNSLAYVAGPLGDFYQPSTSTLINEGSTYADEVGLCAYTVITNLNNEIPIEETNSIVDIGYHYPAAGTNGNLAVSTNITPLQMAQMLVGANVYVANATFTGSNAARGTFAGGFACVLPLDYGVIMSTGYITNAIGPNNGYGNDGILNQPGDTDLSDLVTNYTYDAAVLQFDIVSTNSFTLQFQYIYASVEYPEHINTYPDPMAIYVSTNKVGTNWVNSITNDIALVPGTTNVPVNTSTINGGCVDDDGGNYDSPVNGQYYLDNTDPGGNAAVDAAAIPVCNVQYNGMTVLLTAQASISANITNHVKIAIADYGDEILDSAIFLKAQSSTCP
jgi:hypothetical protein